MSNPLAIAAVTETLANLITTNLDSSGIAGAQVTVLNPASANGLPNPGVNIYLYQISPNTAYRNADLPTRAPDGTLITKPQAAIDLHYLFTFYGDDTQCEQQRMLASVALTMHANPVLPRSLITNVQGSIPYLANSTLDTQAELIRFTPIVFTLEELSKLWSFLLKIDYVLSTAYSASVVLIQADDPVSPPALPVLSYGVTTQAIEAPVIMALTASPDPSQPILDGGTLAITGVNLNPPDNASTAVVITGTTILPSSVTPTSITLALPPGSFSAGPQTAQIIQPLSLGSPPVPHPGTGVTSGVFAFTLLPSITSGVTVGAGPTINFTVTPAVQAGQRAVLQLTSQAGGGIHLFDGGTLTAASAALAIPAAGLASGTYFVQILVDGALSPLTPATGTPTGPLVTL